MLSTIQVKIVNASQYFNGAHFFINSYRIDDGWYAANIKYTNYATSSNANYRLKVKVDYDRVTLISFGNGGSVHTGLNNEGYLYTGGNLSEERDYNGNIIALTTTVNISDRNGMRIFKIRIE